MQKKKRMSLLYSTTSMVATALVLSGIGLVLPKLQQDIGLSLTEQGTLVSIQYFGFTIAVLLGGMIADRVGKIIVFKASLFGALAGCVLLVLTRNYLMAVAAVALLGAFGAVMENECTAIALDCEKERQERAGLTIQIGYNIGAMLIPLIFYFLPALGLGWKTVYILVCIVLVLLALISLAYKNKKPETAAQSVWREWGDLIRKPRYLIAPVTMFLYLSGEVGVWAFIPTYVQNSGESYLTSVLATVAIWAGMIAGKFITGAISKQRGLVGTMKIFVFITLAGVLAILLLPSTFLVPAALLCGIGFGPFFPFIISWMKDITGSGSSSMIAVTMGTGSIGPIVCGVLTGWLGEHFGAAAMMAVPLVCFLLIGVMLFSFGRVAADPK